MLRDLDKVLTTRPSSDGRFFWLRLTRPGGGRRRQYVIARQPHRWPDAQRAGLDYPPPIVDHGKASVRALEAYKAAKVRGGARDEPR